MGKVLVYVFDQMSDYGVSFICHILRENAGKEVVTIGDDKSLKKTTSGFLFYPEYEVSEIELSNIEGLILCGGYPPKMNEGLIDLIRLLHQKKILIAAIGASGTLSLAQAGILENLNYTSIIERWDSKLQFEFGEVDPFPRSNNLKKRLVRDQHVITAHDMAFLDFTIEVLWKLNVFKSRHEKQNFMKLVKYA